MFTQVIIRLTRKLIFYITSEHRCLLHILDNTNYIPTPRQNCAVLQFAFMLKFFEAVIAVPAIITFKNSVPVAFRMHTINDHKNGRRIPLFIFYHFFIDKHEL